MDRRALLKLVPGAALAISLPAVANAVSHPTDVDAIVVPPMTPQQRAKFHYDEMAKALNELSADTHGWTLYASEKQPFEHLMGGRYTGLSTSSLSLTEEGRVRESHIPLMGVL
ncbi:hypothetical protein [Rhizobium sp. L245/93]|uniref:hypothetical protein n=1 Tax=Rhizobium sp. L245/93 TaxID=2819998 RepID=UPI001ADD2428|nr:hypothetical protein [Rhizobium sp. L245/93]MBO9168424.1 hypothetical protein [Rhizobium sp. L245/93]